MKTRNHPLTGMMLALATLAGAATMSLAQVASSPEERLPYPSDYVAQQPEMPMPRLVEDQHEKCTTESCTRNDCRVLILPPLRRGELCSAGCEAPTECEVLRALGLAKDSKECACIEKSRDNVKVFREKIVDKVDAPRFFPLVGMAQLHHCSWQCTALFSETMQIDYPFLMKIKTQRSEVVYIDKDHLHLCTAAESAWAAKSEIALLPTDTIAFATIRVADMLDKLGINSQLDTMAPFSELKEKYAISFMNIERCTFALFDTKGSAGAAIIRLVDKPAHLKEFQAQLKKIFQAVQIIDDRTIIIGSNPAALQRCGQTDRKPCESELACARALEMADQHDFFAWGRLSALPPVDSFVLPSGIESGTVMIDLGDQITLDIRVACADEESTRWTQKALQTGLDLLRAQLLTANAVYRSADLIPGLADSNSVKEFQHLPVKTMRLAEKALQGADLINDGTEVHLSIALPMNTRMVRSEIAAVMRLMGDDKCDLPTFAENKQIGGKCTIGEAFYTAQENKQTAVAGNAAQTNATATATAFPCQGAWVAGAVCQSMDSRQAVYTMHRSTCSGQFRGALFQCIRGNSSADQRLAEDKTVDCQCTERHRAGVQVDGRWQNGVRAKDRAG